MFHRFGLGKHLGKHSEKHVKKVFSSFSQLNFDMLCGITKAVGQTAGRLPRKEPQMARTKVETNIY